MKKLIAYAVIIAVFLGSAMTTVQAAPLPVRADEVRENTDNRHGPGSYRPQPQPVHRPGPSYQPGRPGNHRPPQHNQRPQHRPDYRPGGHYGSSSSKNGAIIGLIAGSVIGAIIAGSSR